MAKTKTQTIAKRCDCSPRAQAQCSHPYHFSFYHQKSAKHYGTAKHRYSLSVLAQMRGVPVPTTKDAAQSFAEALKIEIRAGVFTSPHGTLATPTTDPSALTVEDIAKRYLAQHVCLPTRRVSSQKAMQAALTILLRTLIPGAGGVPIRFGSKPIRDVVGADIEAIRSARRAAAVSGTRRGGEVGVNRLLERARHLLNWSVKRGYRADTPFQTGGVAMIELTTETKRTRRLLDASEEARLLAAAPQHLKDLIIAATYSGLRRGELLSLQWKHVRVTTTSTGQTRQALVLKAENTKTNVERVVPVSARLATVLTMRRHAPDGVAYGPNAYVFGNAAGEQVKSIKKSWMTTVLRAYGHTPTWVKGGKNQLSVESRAAYQEIDLHFHDLRREFGSRILETGSTIVAAQHLLGHSDPEQTSTYLAVTEKGKELAIDKLDAVYAPAEPPAATPPPVVAPGSERVQ